MLKASFIVLAMGMMALAIAQSAVAGKPTVDTSNSPFDYVSNVLCGFPLRTTGSLQMVTTTFTDSSGTAVRSQMRVREEGTFTGPTGRVATFSSVVTQTTDLATGITAVDGTITHVVAPGVGMLLHDAGRVVEDTASPPTILFIAGRHPTLEPGAWASACAYLEG